MAFLKTLSGEAKDTRIEIEQDETSLGRAPDNDLPISSAAASSRHCRIVRDGRAYTLKDLGSTNGTALNGIMIREARLKPKDIVAVGGVEILFDGDDVDVTDIAPELAHGPSNTVLMSPAPPPSTDRPASFATRKDNRRKWIGLIVALGVVALGLLVVFAYLILRTKSG